MGCTPMAAHGGEFYFRDSSGAVMQSGRRASSSSCPCRSCCWLFTRQPLGRVGFARPRGRDRAAPTGSTRGRSRSLAVARRCLWCGGAARRRARASPLDEPPGRTSWRACGGPHAGRLARTLGWAARHRRVPRRRHPRHAGRSSSLLAVAAALGRPAWLRARRTRWPLFRLGVAVTVLPFGWLAPATRGPAPEASRPGHRAGLAPCHRARGQGQRCRSRSTSRPSLGTVWVAVALPPRRACGGSRPALVHLARRLA